MKCTRGIYAAMLAVSIIAAQSAHAIILGEQITIYDGASSGSRWNGPNEDQEVESGSAPGQARDMEGFFLDGTTLNMVGGRDLPNLPRRDVGKGGDIFIDVDGDVRYGDEIAGLGSYANEPTANWFGYDYVLDMDYRASTYSVLAIDETATLNSVTYRHNRESNAWRYQSGGDLLLENVEFGWTSGLTDLDVGFLGGLHFATTVDLSFLAPGTDFTTHFTLRCGNDNLMGYGTIPEAATANAPRVPDGGATLALLGSGILGLLLMRRR